MKAEIPPAYGWLKDALQPHCNVVFCASADHGREMAIGVTLGNRRAVKVIETPAFSLNTEIAEGRITADSVVQDILQRIG